MKPAATLIALALMLACATDATAKASTAIVPAPPRIQYVSGSYPGDPEGGLYAATTDMANGIVYYTPPLARSTKAHEAGHVLDEEILTDGDRNFFTRLMGLSGPWNQGSGYSGLRSPREWFADWYGNAANGRDGTHSWDSAYAPAPDPKAFKRFREALDRLARRNGLAPYVP